MRAAKAVSAYTCKHEHVQQKTSLIIVCVRVYVCVCVRGYMRACLSVLFC